MSIVAAQAVITYEGVHGLGRKDPRQLQAAFSACVAAFGFEPDPPEQFFSLDLAGDDDAFLNGALVELTRDYGPATKKIQGSSTDGREFRAFLWQIREGAIEEAFARVRSLRGRGGLLESRTKLKLIWKFWFQDPVARGLLPGQDSLPRLEDFPGGHGDRSSIVLNLGPPSSASLWFLFPFSDPGAPFASYAAQLQAVLPLTFATKGWRWWTLARSGHWRARKITPELSGGRS